MDGKMYTLMDAGRRMGITRERVRQIEAQAMKRLRAMATEAQLQAFLIA
jgi:RNA polymerase primary sigma factor